VAKSRRGLVEDSSAALTRQKIVKAAVQIVDKEGLAALSMRHLGAALGVDPMAIYYHLPNKAALYDAIVEAVMAEVDVGPDPRSNPGPALSPIEQLRQMALSYRDALLAHPNSLPVVATRPVRTPASLRPIERMLAVIASLGFTAQESIAFVDVCGHYIMGWAQTYGAHLQGSELHDHGPMPMDELPPDEFPNLHRVMKEASSDNPFAVEFELGITAILNGVLSAAHARRPS
jgi:TetR/AcrR family transcriptional regulator, tetracycline repressor protein